MTSLNAVEKRLRQNRKLIADLRRMSRKLYGRDRALWPQFRLEHIQRLIVECRADESTLKQAFWPDQAQPAPPSSPPPRRRAILSLVVDNEKAFSK